MAKKISPKEWERIFKVLGNINRLNILRLLTQKRELSVKAIADALELGIKITSQHLVILSHASMVEGMGKIGSVYYSLHPDLIREIRHIIKDLVQ